MEHLEKEIVFFEIAMEIGNSLDLKEMCSRCLKIIVKKLNASFGQIILCPQNSPATGCTPIAAIPRRHKRETQCRQMISQLNRSPENDFLDLALDGGHYYIFRLQDIGYLIFCRKDALGMVIAKTLFLLTQKLTIAIQACLNHDLLKKSLEQARASEIAKSEFLANMSHEIRTPMNSILGYLDLVLEHPDLPDAERDHLMIAKKSADSLLGIINDVLDFSKLEKGKMAIENRPFSLHLLITEIQEAIELSILEKGLKFHIHIDPAISGTVMGDPFRLKQVILNLLSNAVKFTPKGHIALKVAPAIHDHALQFTVEDTGIGIPPDRLTHIFEAFGQADSSTTRRFGGTGLGTAIARELIELMDGQIWAKSREGSGTRFYFTIPAKTAEPQPRETMRTKAKDRGASPAFRRGFRVLLVEDSETNIRLAQIRLERQGHYLTVARNGREAVAAFESGQGFDVILMDIHMPEMSGIEATLRIRELEAATEAGIPIIAMTAGVMTAEKAAYLSAGMNDVVAKPIVFDCLFKTMDALVPEKAGKPKILVVDDEPQHLQLIRKMLEGQFQLSFATDGKNALKAAAKILPDLLLLDTIMPEMDGCEVFRRLTRDPKTANIPVIFMTAENGPPFRSRLAPDQIPVIGKPVDPGKIQKMIHRHFPHLTQ